MIERALILEGRSAATADVDTLYASFVAHYGEHIADRSRPFPSSSRCWTAWRRRATGLRYAPTSSNGCRSVSLDALQLSDRFTAICGPDTFGIHKPDPQIFRATVLKAGGEPHRASWSGISITDIRTARAANVPVVAVDFGYTDVPVATLGPDRVISAFGELPAAIAALGACEECDGRSVLYQATILITCGLYADPCRLIWSCEAGSERPAADLRPGLGGSARDCSETPWKRLPMDSVDVKRAEGH